MPSANDALVKVGKLITQGWTQTAIARDSQGIALPDPYQMSAVSWCLTGAILRAVDDISERATRTIQDGDLLIPAIQAVVGLDLQTYNDDPGRTQAQVVGDLSRVPNHLGSLIIRRYRYDHKLGPLTTSTTPPPPR